MILDSLTNIQIKALKDANSRGDFVKLFGFPSALLGGLTRRGLLKSLRQSEYTRWEGRASYTLYRTTDAGRKALS